MLESDDISEKQKSSRSEEEFYEKERKSRNQRDSLLQKGRMRGASDSGSPVIIGLRGRSVFCFDDNGGDCGSGL